MSSFADFKALDPITDRDWLEAEGEMYIKMIRIGAVDIEKLLERNKALESGPSGEFYKAQSQYIKERIK